MSRTLPAARKAGAAIVGVAFTRVVRVARPEAVAIAVKGEAERRRWSKLRVVGVGRHASSAASGSWRSAAVS